MSTRRALFTRRKSGDLMATFRPQVHIGLADIEVAMYRALVRNDALPTTRAGALRLAVESTLRYGLFHIEDFEEQGLEAQAQAHARKLFPELVTK